MLPEKSPKSGRSVVPSIRRPVVIDTPGRIRLVLLAAHPDDESIGASAALGRARESRICYLTDGAARDPQFRPGATGTREEYARMRREEACAALSLAGIPRGAVISLGAVDQEAIEECVMLLDRFVKVVREFAPDIIITHAYEGGHPDHDTAALIARAAWQELAAEGGTAPELLEMASYHNRDGERIAGEFLTSGSADTGDTVTLTEAEGERKRRMLACYTSQREVLRDFPLEPERLRAAPSYDFTQPPHAGQLWYEYLGWRMTGTRWRELAAEFLQHPARCV